jgi:transcriptional regulator with XRE-family HTH domain
MQQLARKSGVHRATIERLEEGHKLPTLTTLDKIAKGLGGRLDVELIEWAR